MGKRYYVDYSSWFNTHPYNRRKIRKAVAEAGGTNIRESYNFGWSNQPKVVTFSAGPSIVEKVKRAVGKALGTQWIIIREKDW